MNSTRFSEWLDRYGQAWETGNADEAILLFTEDASYFETPFDRPMIGREAIRKYWQEGAGQAQRDVRFSYQVLAAGEDHGIALWQATLIRVRSGNQVTLDGALLANFDEQDRCTVFREWWHRLEREKEKGPAR